MGDRIRLLSHKFEEDIITKTDLVDASTSKVKKSKTTALETVDAPTESIADALKKGDNITSMGFVNFDVAKIVAKEGGHLQSRQKIKIKLSKNPLFKAGTALKNVVISGAMISKIQEKELTATDLGTRYKCYRCSTKFYDLGRPQPLCPTCGANQNDDAARGLSRKKKKRRAFSSGSSYHTITAPVDNEEAIEVFKVDDDYTLDMDDLVIEGHEEADTDSDTSE